MRGRLPPAPTSTHQSFVNVLQEDELRLMMPRVELDESALSHLFRHASEITRETKGGYLHGKIELPEVYRRPGQAVYLRISLAPAAIDFNNNPLNLHPNLMHINMKTNKRARKLVVRQ